MFSETAITEPWVEVEGEWWIEGDSVATTGSLLSVGEDGGSTQKSVTDVPSRLTLLSSDLGSLVGSLALLVLSN